MLATSLACEKKKGFKLDFYMVRVVVLLIAVVYHVCLGATDVVRLGKDAASPPASAPAAASTPEKIDVLRKKSQEDKEAALAKVQQINNVKRMTAKLEARIAAAKKAKKAAADELDLATDHVANLEQARRKIDRAVDDGSDTALEAAATLPIPNKKPTAGKPKTPAAKPPSSSSATASAAKKSAPEKSKPGNKQPAAVSPVSPKTAKTEAAVAGDAPAKTPTKPAAKPGAT